MGGCSISRSLFSDHDLSTARNGVSGRKGADQAKSLVSRENALIHVPIKEVNKL
jgi:hypothetical protein